MTAEQNNASNRPVQITVWSDYVWPFCYIGLYRIERLKKEYGVTVEWKAFELHPETPPQGSPRPQRQGAPRASSLPSPLKILADEVGIQLNRPDFTAFSRPALEAAEFAREIGKFEEFHSAVFKAYWQDHKNIGQTEVLYEIAEACGIDGDGVEAALYEARYTRLVNRHAVEAAMLGINGIPSYIIGNHLIEGARPWQIFELAMQLNGIPPLSK